MSLLSSNNLRCLGRGDGTVSIGNKTTSTSQGRVPRVSVVSVVYIVHTCEYSMSEMSSLSSKDLRSLSRGNGTTWVSNEL